MDIPRLLYAATTEVNLTRIGVSVELCLAGNMSRLTKIYERRFLRRLRELLHLYSSQRSGHLNQQFITIISNVFIVLTTLVMVE
eukprot:scaffold2849_cov174-Amphora_coffeaeformis.AAC.24